MYPTQVPQAFLLMALGILVVFCFLVFLSLIISGYSRFMPKLAFMLPDPVPAAPKKPAAKKDAGAEIALAIALAHKRAGK